MGNQKEIAPDFAFSALHLAEGLIKETPEVELMEGACRVLTIIDAGCKKKLARGEELSEPIVRSFLESESLSCPPERVAALLVGLHQKPFPDNKEVTINGLVVGKTENMATMTWEELKKASPTLQAITDLTNPKQLSDNADQLMRFVLYRTSIDEEASLKGSRALRQIYSEPEDESSTEQRLQFLDDFQKSLLQQASSAPNISSK